MKGQGYQLRSVLVYAVILGTVSVVGLIIHELGHGLTAEILGGEFKTFFVMPGIQLWPHPGKPYPGTWPGYIGLAQFGYGPGWTVDSWQVGIILLMGSGSTLLVGICALSTLWVFHPLGWLRYVFRVSSLMFIDVLFYTFLPTVGLRHWIFFGGHTPEPLEGALILGVPRWIFMLVIALVSTLLLWGLVMQMRQYRSTSKSYRSKL